MTASNDTPFPDIARATAERHDMLPAGAVVLAMVSGGADSVALLHLLARGDLGADRRVSALHVNHLLRGEAADGDEAFVCTLCERLGVTLAVERVDVAAYAAEHGLNLEDAGRQVRYALADTALDDACAEAGISPAVGRIAVAHTRDDRHETFLMRLSQGAGAAGLTTLAPVRDRVVRPLIDAGRDDVRGWLQLLGEQWREDESNTDTSRLRARVRADLLPLLRDINPRFDEALARTIEVLADESALLGEMADAFGRDFARRSGDAVEFDCAMMATLSTPMRRRTVRAALFAAFPAASRLEFEHVEALVRGVEQDGFARDLPGGLSARTRYGTMTVSCADEGARALAPGLLRIPGTLALGDAGTIHARMVDPRTADGGRDTAVFDADALGSELEVTGVREGDRMRPLGMEGSRKLSDMLVDAKVPRRMRAVVPVVRSGGTVVWLAGVRMAEEYKVTSETRAAVELAWRRPGSDPGSESPATERT